MATVLERTCDALRARPRPAHPRAGNHGNDENPHASRVRVAPWSEHKTRWMQLLSASAPDPDIGTYNPPRGVMCATKIEKYITGCKNGAVGDTNTHSPTNGSQQASHQQRTKGCNHCRQYATYCFDDLHLLGCCKPLIISSHTIITSFRHVPDTYSKCVSSDIPGGILFTIASRISLYKSSPHSFIECDMAIAAYPILPSHIIARDAPRICTGTTTLYSLIRNSRAPVLHPS